VRGTFTVVAIISTFNEADIIEQVVRDFIDQGVEVYLLDDGSTDDTVQLIEPLVGHGVRQIERLGLTGGGSSPQRFEWSRILQRKEQLAAELDADWFIHNDADEFRESPWPEAPLREAISRVDHLGYSAIDSVRLDFWPTHDRFAPGDDVRRAFTEYAPAEAYDRIQVRCWKKQTAAVDLSSSGGHEARFDDRMIFPIKFLLRHYPLRGQSHGRRKIFTERQPRFIESERDRGWHVQYDRFTSDASVLRDRQSLRAFDAAAVRLDLWRNTRDVDALMERISSLETIRDQLRTDLDTRNEELAVSRRDAANARAELNDASAQLGRAHADISSRQAALDGLQRDASQVSARLEEVLQSRSWRWTEWLRSLSSTGDTK
jgi:hypothetical protein